MLLAASAAKGTSRQEVANTQSVEEGENSPAYTWEYEDVLAKAGIFMYQRLDHATISDTCKELCASLLVGEYETPEHSLFQGDSFWTTLDRVRVRNKARVIRDITPSIVPSAELLYIRGLSHLQHLTEETSVQWTKCICLSGPRPQPDYAVGLRSSVFTKDEIEKLKGYTTPWKATLFTGNLYFPFLTCEVVSGEIGLCIADRRNALSASMAINAIVQLYQTVFRAKELHQKILVFSISHDNTMVRIYGHYPLINGGETTFCRYLVRSFDLRDQNGKDKWTAYKFTRKLYDKFSQIHIERIRSVIPQFPDPELESFASTTSTESESLS